jgi:hypothetical protein
MQERRRKVENICIALTHHEEAKMEIDPLKIKIN